ncbi:VTT domain-containing protein [Candidatus Kaiserbacteria bacterium]|nr:MAG: VTT domain-containing protein [Candidatus Kaiserbacteria bacterium]
MLHTIETSLLSLVHTLPLEWFVLIASIVEEIVAPIPSPTVMVLAGSAASVQSYGYIGLLFLVCIGAVGKTFGALVVYGVAYHAEDFVLRHFGKFFEITPHDIERLSAKIGTGFRAYWTLTLFRALPIMPSSLVSVGGGVLKVPVRIFVVSAFLGTLIRDGLYLYAGYVGTEALSTFITQSTHIESFVQYGVLGLIVLGCVYFIYKKKFFKTPKNTSV